MGVGNFLAGTDWGWLGEFVLAGSSPLPGSDGIRWSDYSG